ncbi:hypothetical protein SK3146_02859 [Paenibacillus konkukensis]|uniref:Uncharacterized protein n=1 Tax=Paenibacillus konkukensis TaxID=2020716 RepID=A0ABY4RME3_9BACL|nr:hypothetical protein [Paenibacillus konkukensis]UQZ83652.1 hypothetical protein SK3146_02859 [Paenibacillus konkukensis]
MTTYSQAFIERRNAIRKLAANKALELPLLPSGFWFHSDVRDNFYYAIHLFAYCSDPGTCPELGETERQNALKLASGMISRVLSLQMQHPEHPMYGHWPLNLGSDPAAAKPSGLPVELMGCLIILFYNQYQDVLPLELKSELNIAIVHMYQSSVYRQQLEQIHHHEAKHTSLKLLLGHQFDDQELLGQGLRFAKQQLEHIRTFGFKEYGALPWHWHWIQSFTCVWQVVDDSAVRETVTAMLEHLWSLRADVYLKGAWVGAQSRQWPHDGPKDNNTLLDYIQFGDFPQPSVITRLEGAYLYTYQIPESIYKRGVERSGAEELKRKIRFAGANGQVQEEAHTYAYITPDYAAGGIWERREEFDNEQQRWDITLPLTDPAAQEGVNQAFFFHPGAKYKEGDDRHASNYGEVLLHQDTAIQLWAVPAEDTTAHPGLVGCLPKGDWTFAERSGCGKVGHIYIVFHLMNPFTAEERSDRFSIASPLVDGLNGVVMEAISAEEAARLGINNLAQFAAAAQTRQALFQPTIQESGTEAKGVSVRYTTRKRDELALTLGFSGPLAIVNGTPVRKDDYIIR